jgi:pimeloyl-ACP methyl ester carboxylesterase
VTKSNNFLIERDYELRAAFSEQQLNQIVHHATFAGPAGVRSHYVFAGKGPLVVLLHGNPQFWREWRFIIPPLVDAGYRVLAPDLRGFGQSDRPLDGYDSGAVAEDIRGIVASLGAGKAAVVGHDAGAGAAYAWAAAHPGEVTQLVLIEAIPAGLEPGGGLPTSHGKPMWHPGFMMTADLPEALLAGRERLLLEYLFRSGAHDPSIFTDAEIDVYLAPFAALGGVRGAFSHYRARAASTALNARLAKRRLTLPVLTVAAEDSYGVRVEQAMRGVADDVRGVVADQVGHWIPEERPAWLAHHLLKFLSNG